MDYTKAQEVFKAVDVNHSRRVVLESHPTGGAFDFEAEKEYRVRVIGAESEQTEELRELTEVAAQSKVDLALELEEDSFVFS